MFSSQGVGIEGFHCDYSSGMNTDEELLTDETNFPLCREELDMLELV